MTRKWMGSAIRTGLVMAVCVAVAAPAYAQLGSLKGRVVDEDGNPVPEADLTFEYAGEMNYKFESKSEADGTWIRAGLYAVGGRWTITARKGNMAGFIANVDVPLSDVGEAGDIVIKEGGLVPDSTSGMSIAEVEARNQQAAQLKALFDEVNAALDTNSYAVALEKLNEAAEKVPDCAQCYVRIGDVYFKQGEQAQAEEAYNTAIEMDPTFAEPYDGLAVLYNSQKKFTEAAEASAKASELRASSGGAQDPTALYNAGAILVNSGNMAEAQVQFQRAIAADPTMAEAHYQLAMTLINQGKIAEAITPLEQYLSLAPDGPNAETAKMMLPELQKMIQ